VDKFKFGFAVRPPQAPDYTVHTRSPSEIRHKINAHEIAAFLTSLSHFDHFGTEIGESVVVPKPLGGCGTGTNRWHGDGYTNCR
jgi:hypothetical protein